MFTSSIDSKLKVSSGKEVVPAGSTVNMLPGRLLVVSSSRAVLRTNRYCCSQTKVYIGYRYADAHPTGTAAHRQRYT